MGRKSEDNSSEYGEPAEYDPTFNGPIHNRTCTDIFCCFLFMAIIAGYMIVGVLAWLYGDPRYVLYPRDSTGMFCGIGQNRGKPNVFYFNLLKCATETNVLTAAVQTLQCPTTQVCVGQCPSDFWILPSAAYLPNAKAKDFFQQKYCVASLDLSTTTLTVQEIVNKDLCPSFYSPSSSVLGRCLPSSSSLKNIPSNFTLPGITSVNEITQALNKATKDVLSKFSAAKHMQVKIFEDFASSWYWILIGLLVAMLLSLIFLLLLRFVAPILVWLLIAGVLGVVAYGIWHCYWEHTYRDITMTIGNLTFSSDISAFLDVRETWLAFMIILCIVEAILLLIIIFLRSHISLAIALFQESSKVLRHMISTLLYPIITFILLAVCVAYWGITALYLATSGAPIYEVVALSSSKNCQVIKTEACSPVSFNSSAYATCPSVRCIFIGYNEEGIFQRNLFNLQIYNVLAFLWCANFVIALGQCTLAGAFASYYWAFSKPSDIPTFPLSQAFIRSLRYHVGSLAFGALILTIGQVCRIFLEYLYSKFGDPQNPFTRFIACCLKCCFWTLDKFIKFLNRNAYIMIAIYGKNFCVSAKKAFRLLMRNILRVVVLDKVTDLLLFFCKILVVAAVGVLSFFFFSGRIPLPGNTFQHEVLNYYWVPIITVIVGAYFIAQGFFSVYSMCVDTLFLCFLEDLERNDGTIQKPYYMPKNLLRILLKMNDVPKRGK